MPSTERFGADATSHASISVGCVIDCKDAVRYLAKNRESLRDPSQEAIIERTVTFFIDQVQE